MRRRDFLRASAAAAAAAAAGVALSPRSARAFGEPPEGAASALLPPGNRADSILECFLYGGLSLWESFYCVDDYGRPDDPDPDLRDTQYWSFMSGENPVLAQVLALCGEPEAKLTPFGTDALGKTVKLGPLARLLVERSDLVSRMRVVVNRHELEPHEAAIPLALSGRPLGAPTAASLGAHVQRAFLDRGGPPRKSPFSYALATRFAATDNVRAAVMTGAHPGEARPLLLKVDDGEKIAQLLARPAAGSPAQRAQRDALVRVYIEQARARTRFGGQGEPLRSPALAQLSAAARAVEGAPSVEAMLPAELFTPFSTEACGNTNVDVQGMSLRLCAHLLTHPVEPARYACFVDTGLFVADGGGGYDTHTENSLTQTRNLRNLLSWLTGAINQPGEADPAKIDLDKTMIVLNMEFGRSPGKQGKYGRNHWPHGYAQIYLGGPIGPDQAGVFGAIGPDGVATHFTTPAENRIACLLSLGLWPFHRDGFSVADVQGDLSDVDAVLSVTERVLGHKA